MGKVRSNPYRLLPIGVVLLVLAGAICWLIVARGSVEGLKPVLVEMAGMIRSEETPVGVFIALMAVLPIIGFPLSLFLVAAGLKFGLPGGMAVLAAAMPIHLAGAYLLARLLRNPILGFARKAGYDPPQIPASRAATFAFVFFAIPGIPYALKNLLLPLGGIPFRVYFFIGWIVQWVMGIPFMGVGDSAARMNPYVLGGSLALLLMGYLLIRWIRSRYGHIVGER